MSLYMNKITNDWGKYSKNAHVLMPKSPKISRRHKFFLQEFRINLEERGRRFFKGGQEGAEEVRQEAGEKQKSLSTEST